jgi:hypothetical protein
VAKLGRASRLDPKLVASNPTKRRGRPKGSKNRPKPENTASGGPNFTPSTPPVGARKDRDGHRAANIPLKRKTGGPNGGSGTEDGGKQASWNSLALRAHIPENLAIPPGPAERVEWFRVALSGGDPSIGIPKFRSGRTIDELGKKWGLSPSSLYRDCSEARRIMVRDVPDEEEARAMILSELEQAQELAQTEHCGSRTVVEACRVKAELLGAMKPRQVEIRSDGCSLMFIAQAALEPSAQPTLDASGEAMGELEAESAEPVATEKLP